MIQNLQYNITKVTFNTNNFTYRFIDNQFIIKYQQYAKFQNNLIFIMYIICTQQVKQSYNECNIESIDSSLQLTIYVPYEYVL